MAKTTVNHKGHSIVIEGEEDQLQLAIDGEQIPVQFDRETNRYVAFDYLAYTDYESPLDLAKSIVESGLIGQ